MPYPPAFLAIQLTFARAMATLTGSPVPDAILRRTALYRIMGLDWSLDPAHPDWRRFIQAVGDDGANSDAAYAVYAERCARGLVPEYETSLPHWGCFSYEFDAGTKVVRLHFANLDTSGYGPLSSQRREARLADLRGLFADVAQEHPDAERVHGGTWLYNRKEYTRLFPREYGDSTRVDHPHLIARGLWGQFLRHGNRINEEVAATFFARLADLRDADDCAACFPYQNLLTDAPAAAFYSFYGVDHEPR